MRASLHIAVAPPGAMRVRGDIARMLFYMDVRSAGDDGVPDLALIDEDSRSGPLLGHLSTLLAWH